MILVSCIVELITAMDDPSAYYPHNWIFVSPQVSYMGRLLCGWHEPYVHVEMVVYISYNAMCACHVEARIPTTSSSRMKV